MNKEQIVIVKGIITYNNKVLIVKRSNYEDLGSGHWEFVGGKLNGGETLEEALIREAKEEVGLNIVVDKILYATPSNIDPEKLIVVIVYKCFVPNLNVSLSKEHSDFKWVNRGELKTYLAKDIYADLEKRNVLPEIFQ